jgi:hypothetical protein
MKTTLTIIIAAFLFVSINAQTYKKILIKLNSRSDIELLNKSGIDLEGAISLKGMTAKLFVSEAELRKVNSLGLSYSVLIDDWNKFYNSQRLLTQPEMNQILEQSRNQYGVAGFGYGSMGGFYIYDEVNAQLDSMHARYPNLVTQKQSIGTTAGGRVIYMVKITNSLITGPKPQVSYNAMHHAREPMGMECLIYFMYYMLENYSTNSAVKYLVDTRELYFVPICNPDGYEYNRSTNPSGGGLWRKNRKDNGDGTFGVDLNRNYGPTVYWNAPNGGSSTVSSDETYRGAAPFSENETAAIKNYYAAHKFKNSVSYHTYGNDLVFPYGALPHETADSIFFREYARDMTGYNGYIYGTDLETVGYSTRGNSDDYFYDGDTVADGGKIFAMTPEVGTDFWPPQSEIIPDVQINILPNLYWAWFAGDFATLKNINFDRVYFKGGDTASIRPIIRNKGLATVKSLTFEAASLNSNCTFINNTQAMDSISSRSERTFSNPLKFVISTNTPSAQKVKITFTTKIGGIITAVDTINFTIGIPTFIFADTTNNPVNLWTIAATPSGSPKWDATTSDYHSAPNCYTDSKTGNYVSNATVTMTSTNSINLSGYVGPILSFWTKWEIETLYDCGVLQISTDNGSTWSALTGTLTKAASGTGRQIPSGMPIYDGTHYYWTQELVDLSAYSGKQIKLRFALWSDGGTERDGWYVDDINIYNYGTLPVELTSFTANAVNNTVKLNWKTATELNNIGFEVQRSRELNSFIGGWKTIGFVKGSGTSVSGREYSFKDINPIQGKQYYRIKQNDANGTFTIYGPVEANNLSNIILSLEQNYPNPFNPSTMIKYTLPAAGIVTIKIYNVLGSEVATLLNEYKEGGIYSFNFSINELKTKISSGVYLYTIKAGQSTLTRKMVIMK